MKTITILTLSRNRPKRLDNFIRSVYDTADHTERIQILNYIDLDDTSIEEYKKLEDGYALNCTSYYILEIFMVPICQYQSHGMRFKLSLGDILIMGNDDSRISNSILGYNTRG